MPPKKAAGGASKKVEKKKKEQNIDDKTFGLKNKKGNKQQKFIENVSKQVMSGGGGHQKEMERKKAADNKKRKELELAEMEALFGKAIPAKKKTGLFADCAAIDPKLKAKKADIYADERDDSNNMSNWTEEELRAAIDKKNAANKNAATTTAKICNAFLDAVEGFKYGWFWECPQGDKCKYRHALPEGYVLKRDLKKLKEAADDTKISLEDLIERERAALGVGTKITLESFNIWKKKKRAEKIKKSEKETKKKKGKAKAGQTGGLTGRELFQFNAEMGGDDEEAEDIVIERENDDVDEAMGVKVHDVDLSYNKGATLSSGAIPTETSYSERFDTVPTVTVPVPEPAAAAVPEPVKPKKSEKSKKSNGKPAPVIEAAVIDASVEVDEDLFGDEDFDIDDLDEQLGDIAIEEAGMS